MALPKVNPVPTPQGFTTKDGGLSTAGYQFLQSLYQGAMAAISGVGSIQSQQYVIDFTIESPDNQDYDFELSAVEGYTINSVLSKCRAGSCTVTTTIGSTALGGGANSASTTLQTKTHSTNNVVAVGGTSKVTISANSSCAGLRLQYVVTPT
jgi:hypothetical protein